MTVIQKIYLHRAGVFSLLACLAMILLPSEAWAQVNLVIENVDENVQSVPRVIVVAGWILGVGFTIAGLIGLKNYAANPDQTPIQGPLIRLLVGGMAIALPYILETSQGTLLGDDSQATAPVVRLYDGGARPSTGAFHSENPSINSAPEPTPYGITPPPENDFSLSR